LTSSWASRPADSSRRSLSSRKNRPAGDPITEVDVIGRVERRVTPAPPHGTRRADFPQRALRTSSPEEGRVASSHGDMGLGLCVPAMRGVTIRWSVGPFPPRALPRFIGVPHPPPGDDPATAGSLRAVSLDFRLALTRSPHSTCDRPVASLHAGSTAAADGRAGRHAGRPPAPTPPRSCCGVYVVHYGVQPEAARHGESAPEFELLAPMRNSNGPQCPAETPAERCRREARGSMHRTYRGL
jgi:hypothetical protein